MSIAVRLIEQLNSTEMQETREVGGHLMKALKALKGWMACLRHRRISAFGTTCQTFPVELENNKKRKRKRFNGRGYYIFELWVLSLSFSSIPDRHQEAVP